MTRFHLGAVPESPDFLPGAGWMRLREPTPWMLQLFAIPLGLAAGVTLLILWQRLTSLRDLAFDSPVIPLVALVAIIPIHELLHALVHPRYGLSDQSVLGCWPSRLVFYAHYLGELSRNRFIAILLLPLLVISLGPLVICAIAGIPSPSLAFVSILNAFFACGDMFAVGLLLVQVPANAVVRNQGWYTFWKLPDSPAD